MGDLGGDLTAGFGQAEATGCPRGGWWHRQPGKWGKGDTVFKRLKGFGSFLGRDFGSVRARATKLKDTEGPSAAIVFLHEALGKPADKVPAAALEGYVRCWLLCGSCEAEHGLSAGEPQKTRDGLHTLSWLARQFRSYWLTSEPGLKGLLREISGFLERALAAPWTLDQKRRLFLPELCALASLWNQAGEPRTGMDLCLKGQSLFPNDPSLVLLHAESQAGLGRFDECLSALERVLQSESPIESPGLIITLLQQAERSTVPAQAHLGRALLATLYCRIERWDQAFETATRAHGLLGDDLDDSSLQALLVSAIRVGRRSEFLEHTRRFLPRPLAPHIASAVLGVLGHLEDPRAPAADLQGARVALSLRAGRNQEALDTLARCLADHPAAAPELAAWCRLGGAETANDPALLLSLASLLVRTHATDEGLGVLLRLASGPCSPDALEESIRLARAVHTQSPANPVATDCLARLLLRHGDLEEALELARALLKIPGSSRLVADLCREVSNHAQLQGRHPLCLAALQLQIDLRLQDDDPAAALNDIQSLVQHPAATLEHLLVGASSLRRLLNNPSAELETRILLGEILTRAVSPKPAAEHFIAAILANPPPRLLERACAGLAHVWNKAADPARARALLARCWLQLGHPREARTPLLECVAARQPEADSLLDLLRARITTEHREPDWLTLSLDAEIAFGDPTRLAAVLESVDRLLDNSPEDAVLVERYALEIEQRTEHPELRTAAILTQARSMIRRRDLDAFQSWAQNLSTRHTPEIRTAVANAVEPAAASLTSAERARFFLCLGSLFQEGNAAEAEHAAACYKKAAEEDPAGLLPALLSATLDLARRDPGCIQALLVAFALAGKLGQASALPPDVIRLLARLPIESLAEARDLLEPLAADPAAPHLRLAVARCDRRLHRHAQAVESYRQLAQSRTTACQQMAADDLRDWLDTEPERLEVLIALADALLALGQIPKARDIMLDWVVRHPTQAEPCLSRLESLQSHTTSTWEDRFAWAEALRHTGRASDAIPVYTSALATPDVPWPKAAAALETLATSLPGNPEVACLWLQASARVATPDRLPDLIDQAGSLIAIPGLSSSLLLQLLADCAFIESRATDRENVALPAALRQAEIQTRLGDPASAARTLCRTLERWPKAAPAIAAFCVQLAPTTTAAAALSEPLARARFAQGDWESGVTALREWVRSDPACRHQADALAAAAAANAPPQPRESLDQFRLALALEAGQWEDATPRAATLLRQHGEQGARTLIALCREYQVLERGSPALIYLWCDACDRLGDVEGSLDGLRAIAQQDLAAHATTLRARALDHARAGRSTQAVTTFLGDLAAQAADWPAAAAAYAQAVEMPNANLSRLREALIAILSHQPANPDALCALARCDWKNSQPALAARWYQQAAASPHPPPLPRLRELCHDFPDCAVAWFVCGETAFQAEDFTLASECLALALDRPGLEPPEILAARKRLADCHARQGRFDDAIDALRSALDLAPDDDDAARRLISLFFEKNSAQIRALEQRLDQEGHTAEILFELGELRSARGEYTEAVQQFRRIPHDHPLAPRALVALGKCHLALNECHLAVTALQAALAAQPAVDDRREALYQLGIAHARLLEHDLAATAFQTLCQECPEYRDAADQLRRCRLQQHDGHAFHQADVPFDLVAAWRKLCPPEPPSPPNPTRPTRE